VSPFVDRRGRIEHRQADCQRDRRQYRTRDEHHPDPRRAPGGHDARHNQQQREDKSGKPPSDPEREQAEHLGLVEVVDVHALDAGHEQREQGNHREDRGDQPESHRRILSGECVKNF
jgi:hypothetical protein